MYHLGIGVTQDFKDAAKLYKKAAEQGDEDASHNLIILCKENPWACKNHTDR